MQSNDNQQRIAFMMIDENTVDNLVLVREDIETKYPNLSKPQNISDVITILINYWYEGTR